MYGDGVLQTADLADVRAGANVLLFETGRVISFTTATQTGTNTYQIAGIKDGRFGSDAGASAATAASGTKVLLLHNHDGDIEGSVALVRSAFSYLNQSITSAFWPSGRDEIALTSTETYTFTAENLRPLAPVDVQLTRGGDSSATLTGRLRTRIVDDGAWNTSSPGTMTDIDGGVYKISVKLNNGTTIVRKDFTSSTVRFSLAMSAADLTTWFGSLPGTLTGAVFMTNNTVGDGRPRAF